ncbi:hypothetical protein AC578_10261 [Pseudocercospora eumusae]|uniref:Uncharacterized protein n=1 Tax=Pseudocercospora eumusae TaxID=321146 RepID=A0A139HZ22_9PEZI|nr:hypothetical protein AC578_10261 [Pseudocercospora eumusae]
MDPNMRATSDQNTLQPIIVQDRMHEFQPVTQARVVLLQYPTTAQYQLHLVVPASVHITPYHTSRKCIRDGFFDIEVAPIPGSSAVYGLKVCLGWDVSLQITRRQQQAPGSIATMIGIAQAVQQTGARAASQAHDGMPLQAPAMRPLPGHTSMHSNQAPVSTRIPQAAQHSISGRGNQQIDFMNHQSSSSTPQPAIGRGGGQQNMPTGLFSTPPGPGKAYAPTKLPLQSASQVGRQFNGNRSDPRSQQRQFSTGQATQSTPTPVAPSIKSHAKAAVPAPSQESHDQIVDARYFQTATTSSPSRKNLQSTFFPLKQPSIDLTRSPGKKLFSPATRSKVIKSSPLHSSTKHQAEMYQKASRAFEDLYSQHGLTAETVQSLEKSPGFCSSESRQSVSTTQASFSPNAGQHVAEMPHSVSPPFHTSLTLNDASSTAEAAAPTLREDSTQPTEEMVPLGDHESLFGEASEVGDGDERFGDDLEDDRNVSCYNEAIQPPPDKTELHHDEGALDGFDMNNFTVDGYDPSQMLDPNFDPDQYDLDRNQEVFKSYDLMLFPELQSSSNNPSPYDG